LYVTIYGQNRARRKGLIRRT